MTMPFREAVNRLDEASFHARCGPSDPMTPEQLADLLADCGVSRIVAGGAGGRPRAIMLPGVALTPDCEQFWVRREAGQPWRFEFLFDLYSTDDEWVYKRDPRVRLPWQRAVHTVGGVEYLRPEIALLFKAKNDRPKDRTDLLAARLDPVSRDWLADTLDLLGQHEWALLTRSAEAADSDAGATEAPAGATEVID